MLMGDNLASGVFKKISHSNSSFQIWDFVHHAFLRDVEEMITLISPYGNKAN